jgi:hypothetical protein
MYRLLGMLLGMKVLSCRRPKHNLGFELGFESKLAGVRLESNKTLTVWTRAVEWSGLNGFVPGTKIWGIPRA